MLIAQAWHLLCFKEEGSLSWTYCQRYVIIGLIWPPLFSGISWQSRRFWELFQQGFPWDYYRDVTITGEGFQIMRYTPHLWVFSSEGSWVCHTYCDTGHMFITFHFEDPWHSHLLPACSSGTVTTCSNDLGLSRPWIETRSQACEAKALPIF